MRAEFRDIKKSFQMRQKQKGRSSGAARLIAHQLNWKFAPKANSKTRLQISLPPGSTREEYLA
jgi:hypothetical protein